MIEKSTRSSEHKASEATRKIIQEVQKTPFSFGFREAFRNGKGYIYTPDDGCTWRMKVQAPTVNGDWYGNCVQSVLLSASVLRSRLPDSTSVVIQYLDAKGLGNSNWGQDHFKVLVEDPDLGLMEYVDHSPFHTKWLDPNNQGISEWFDITSDYEAEVRDGHDPEIDGKLVVIAYTEFDIRDTRGVAFVSLFHKERENFIITFDLVMPGLPAGDTDWRVYLDIEYGTVNKDLLRENIAKDELVYYRGHLAVRNYTQEKVVEAKQDFPVELKESLQNWFAEMVAILPDEIPDPHK